MKVVNQVIVIILMMENVAYGAKPISSYVSQICRMGKVGKNSVRDYWSTDSFCIHLLQHYE
jgi:hypothetical protein